MEKDNTKIEFYLNEMQDEVIKRYGFEAKETINFCNLCEKYLNERNEKNLIAIVGMYATLVH